MNEQHFISEVCVKWQKDIDNAILGEIKQKAIDNGIKTEYVLNEKAIISALEKQIPKKPMRIYDENEHHIKDEDCFYEPALFGVCPICNQEVQDGMLFCSFCGQALDWSDTK